MSEQRRTTGLLLAVPTELLQAERSRQEGGGGGRTALKGPGRSAASLLLLATHWPAFGVRHALEEQTQCPAPARPPLQLPKRQTAAAAAAAAAAAQPAAAAARLQRRHAPDLRRQAGELVLVQAEPHALCEAPQLGRHFGQLVAVQAGQGQRGDGGAGGAAEEWEDPAGTAAGMRTCTCTCTHARMHRHDSGHAHMHMHMHACTHASPSGLQGQRVGRVRAPSAPGAATGLACSPHAAALRALPHHSHTLLAFLSPRLASAPPGAPGCPARAAGARAG